MSPQSGANVKGKKPAIDSCGLLFSQLGFRRYRALLTKLYRLYFSEINSELCCICHTDCFYIYSDF